MGNIIGTDAPEQRAPRAKNVGQEPRQLHREQHPDFATIHKKMRAVQRKKVMRDLMDRPVTSADVAAIRKVLLGLAPPCPQQDFCKLPPATKYLFYLLDGTIGRTLTNEEANILHAAMSDDKPVLNPNPQAVQPPIRNASKMKKCVCQSLCCSECSAVDWENKQITANFRYPLSGYADLPMTDPNPKATIPW